MIMCNKPRVSALIGVREMGRSRAILLENIADERRSDLSERGADDDTDGHIHDIAPQDKLFKFFKHNISSFYFPTPAALPTIF